MAITPAQKRALSSLLTVPPHQSQGHIQLIGLASQYEVKGQLAPQQIMLLSPSWNSFDVIAELPSMSYWTGAEHKHCNSVAILGHG